MASSARVTVGLSFQHLLRAQMPLVCTEVTASWGRGWMLVQLPSVSSASWGRVTEPTGDSHVV